MKRTFAFLAVSILVVAVFAQSPEKISYQAVIRNSSDQLITEQGIGIQVSILKGATDGTPVYVETQSAITNVNGLATIEIGTGTTTDDFSTIDWGDGAYFIKTETDPTTAGGTKYTITGVSQLLSVPYALHSKSAEILTGEIEYSETDPVFSASEAVNITAVDISNLKNLSGINTGDQDLSAYATKDMGNENIINLADPVNDQDAVTKSYVDSLIARIEALEQVIFPPRNGFFSIKNGTDELYFIDLENSSITLVDTLGLIVEEGFFGMQYIDHKLYLSKGGDLYTYNLSFGDFEQILHNDHLAWQFSINSLGEIYSVNELSGFTQGSLYKIDTSSNVATLIGTTGTPSVWGLGFDSADQLWAVDEFYGTYGTINTTTGKFTQYSSATGFPNLVHTTPDYDGNIYSLHGGTVNGIIKYIVSSDEASQIIPLEQGVWLGLAFGKY